MNIGMTVIGGFLGAGKTTLVNHILRHTRDRRIGVLVNDFGAINIDAELIESREGDTIRLANGCICCGLGDDLSRALISVLGQDTRPEHLLIEASGVAEPWRIAELALAAPEFGAARIIVLADAAAITTQLADRYVGDLAASQIGCADILLLNKADLLTPGGLNALQDRMAARWPGLSLITSNQANIEMSALGFDQIKSRKLRSSHVMALDAGEIFCASRLVTRQRFSRDQLAAAMHRLPEGVLRVKGVLYFKDEIPPQILQASNGQWSLSPWMRIMPAEAESRIVAIGLRALGGPAAMQEMFRLFRPG